MKNTSALAVSLSLCFGAACGGGAQSAAEPEEPEDDRVELGDTRPSDRRSAVPDDPDGEDDGTGMQVSGLKGRLDAYDIRAGIGTRSRDLTGCFTQRARKRRYLGGSVKLAFVVDPEGGVKTVQVDESDLGSWEVESCLVETARQIAFARPKGGEAEFEVPLEFDARRRVQIWNEDRLATELGEERLAELAECEPAASDVWVTLYVGSRGKVLSVGFASGDGTAIDTEWALCAEQVIEAWTLTDPRGVIAKGFFRYLGS